MLQLTVHLTLLSATICSGIRSLVFGSVGRTRPPQIASFSAIRVFVTAPVQGKVSVATEIFKDCLCESSTPNVVMIDMCASRNPSFDSSARFSEALRRRQRLYEPLQQSQKALHNGPFEERKCQADSARRHILLGSSAGALLALAARSSKAMNMPQAFDNAWSAIGGGPADLVYPEEFFGRWLTESILTKVEMPLGPSFVPNLQVVDRAMREDLKKPIRYEIAWIRNKKGKVIIDRKFNTARLMSVYLGRGGLDEQGITWDPDDPNRLAIRLPGGMSILTRVTRRSEENPAGLDRRINTSEFFEQIFETRDSVEPRVKASQCFTKYKWRPPEEAARSGGPAIVATQVVSDYLTPYDGETMMLKAQNRPVVVYTYTMSFRRAYTSSSPLQA